MPPERTLPAISNVTMRLFVRIVRGYFHRHFGSVMAQNAAGLRRANGPLIVYANHCSWWDPMLLVLLARTLLPERQHYAPIEASALRRHPALRKLGLFPVETSTPSGVTQFVQAARSVLKKGAVLWTTPQGRLADPREFPLTFRPGLAALAARCPEVPLMPLAVEYTFWDDCLPETLVRFGEMIHGDAGQSSERVTHHLECALTSTMLELQHASCARDTTAFEVLLHGRRGVGAYRLAQKFQTLGAKRRLVLQHAERVRLL